MFLRYAPIAALFIAVGSAAAVAEPAFSLSGGAAIVSDYRFRGVSQSGSNPAIEFNASIAHGSGIYIAGWGSTIDLYDDDMATGVSDGQDLEIDGIAGWTGELAPNVTTDVNITYYIFPGVTGPTDYAEALASLDFSLGALNAKIGGGYFPDQRALADDGSYLFGEVSGPISKALTLTAHAGRQFFGSGFGRGADYWEWSVGASRDFGPFSANLSYVDTSLPKGSKAGATVVASLGVNF
jgi:uncharacterized protein (TIGR02001 family)